MSDPLAADPSATRGAASLVGTHLTLDVDAVAHGGHVVARDQEGRVVFVRHALPGERVEAVVTRGKVKDRFLLADALAVENPSPHRVDAPCRYAGPGGCGGCDFQHARPAYQRELKAAVITEQLSRLGGLSPAEIEALDVRVQVVPGDRDGLRWRTRVEFAVHRGQPGLHPHHSRRVLPLEDCLIACEPVAGVLTRRFPRATSVDVVASSTGELAVVEVPHGLRHTPTIHEQVAQPAGPPMEFRLGARDFWQVHPGAAATYVAEALRMLAPRPSERALDLYAGVGVFARALADAVGDEGAVLAVESDRRAVRRGQEWAQGREEVEFRCERVEDALAPLVAGGDRLDVAVLDPPRSGAGAAVVTGLLSLAPRAVLYVACDPAALARDVAIARGCGYTLTQLSAYDAFPMTQHMECLALLTPAG